MKFAREQLVKVLEQASRALGKTKPQPVPALAHFWFDRRYVYAFDGSRGVRLPLPSDIDCGLPSVLLDLVKTSPLAEITLEVDPKDPERVLLKMGRSRISLVSLPPDRSVWPFKAPVPKKSDQFLQLSAEVCAAFKQLAFIEPAQPTHVMHAGVTVQTTADGVGFYATDSKSLARLVLPAHRSQLPRVLLSWEFMRSIGELITPGATLHLTKDCLIVEQDGVLVASTLRELTDTAPDLAKTVVDRLKHAPKPVALPPGLARVLERATILGTEDAILTMTIRHGAGVRADSDKVLSLSGIYPLGSLTQYLPLTGDPVLSGANFPAKLVDQALPYADRFSLSKETLVLYGGDTFTFLLAAYT